MGGIETGSFDSPDETRTPDKAKIEIVKIGSSTVGRATLQPGWRWSESIKPIVGTDSCQVSHFGVLISGRMHVAHDDGSEVDIVPGNVYRIEAGHDAWVVGDEPAVGLEFDSQAAATFAKPGQP